MAASKMHVMRVLDRSGDIPLEWNPADVATQEKPAEAFERLVNGPSHYLAFGFPVAGEEGQVIDHFDKDLPKIVLMPQLQGG